MTKTFWESQQALKWIFMHVCLICFWSLLNESLLHFKLKQSSTLAFLRNSPSESDELWPWLIWWFITPWCESTIFAAADSMECREKVAPSFWTDWPTFSWTYLNLNMMFKVIKKKHLSEMCSVVKLRCMKTPSCTGRTCKQHTE